MGRDQVLARLAGRARVDETLKAAVVDPAAAKALRADRAAIVLGLARRRAATGPTLLLWPLVTGWLVVATVWGFGRAAFPASATTFLLVGCLGAAVTILVGVRRRVAERDSARAVVHALESAGIQAPPDEAPAVGRGPASA